jgi:hypothetical protein
VINIQSIQSPNALNSIQSLSTFVGVNAQLLEFLVGLKPRFYVLIVFLRFRKRYAAAAVMVMVTATATTGTVGKGAISK